jgi:three-Cys-motif partner protein
MSSENYKVKKHTCEIKYPLLKKYFNAYTTVVKNFFPRFFYIDAFASTGKCEESHSGRPVDGSPLIALKLKFPFTDYIFIEILKERYELLKKYVNEYANFEAVCTEKEKGDTKKKINIEVLNDNINNCIEVVLNKIQPNFPVFIFLDPEGLELDWSTVEKCSRRNRVELLINFSISGILRNLENPRAGNAIKSFLGDDVDSRIPMVILDAYKQKLRKHFKHVVEKPVKAENKNIIYYLIFATNNDTGYRIMSSVMGKKGEQKTLFK